MTVSAYGFKGFFLCRGCNLEGRIQDIEDRIQEKSRFILNFLFFLLFLPSALVRFCQRLIVLNAFFFAADNF
jgi:hypothetical protein